MFFHWLKLYGKGSARATADASQIVDSAFKNAQAASPAVFSRPSTHEPERQAKFEHVCPWLALEVIHISDTAAKYVLEEMVDRLEIGLREGGISDMKVGVEVRKYASALHGRVRRYATMLQQGNHLGLAAALTEHGIDETVQSELQNRYKLTTTHSLAQPHTNTHTKKHA